MIFLSKDKYKYLSKLENTQQRNCKYICKYQQAIQEIIKKYSACKKRKEKEHKMKEEYWQKGLDAVAKIEMAKFGLYKPLDIIEKIKTIKEVIEKKSKNQAKYKSVNKSLKPQNETQKTQLECYCRRHRRHLHNDSQCFAQ